MKRPPAQPHLHWRSVRYTAGAVTWASLEDSHAVRLAYNGRAAIYQYLIHLRHLSRDGSRNVVLVPAFHCPTVVDPVIHAGYEVRFYSVDATLRVDREDFLRVLDERVVVALFIRYFGLTRLDRELVKSCRAAGAVVLEDCSHSFLEANPLRIADSGADATTYSFWKLIPGLAGGGLLVRRAGLTPSFPSQVRPRCSDSWARMRASRRPSARSTEDVTSG